MQELAFVLAYCKRKTDCGMDSFRGLTGSESMLWSHAEMTTSHTVQVHEHYRPLQRSCSLDDLS